MCLILFAIKTHPRYKLIIASNRDEYYDRPTSPAGFWEEAPRVLAGKDLLAYGTWLGITRSGRIGALTNYRDPTARIDGAPSRGTIVGSFLEGTESPAEYIEKLEQNAGKHNGFNLIIGEAGRLYWYSNRGNGAKLLSPGIYGLSNHLLDTPWPKVTRGKEALRSLLEEQGNVSPEAFFRILEDRTIADDKSLPATGVALEWERMLSPVFIASPTYGTRSSTLLLIDTNDRVIFIEKTFGSDPDSASSVHYEFEIEA